MDPAQQSKMCGYIYPVVAHAATVTVTVVQIYPLPECCSAAHEAGVWQGALVPVLLGGPMPYLLGPPMRV